MPDETERDPHEDIVRLEKHIEELDAKIESCRKFILASRIAMAAGGIVLAADASRRNPLRSRHNGGSGRGISRGHCRMGFKPQHLKGSGKGADRG